MRIKDRKIPTYRRVLSHVIDLVWRRIFNRRVAIAVLLLIVLFVLGFISGLAVTGTFGKPSSEGAMAVKKFAAEKFGLGPFITKTYWDLKGGSDFVLSVQKLLHPLNYLEGISSSPEKLTIDLKFDNYRRLAYKREQALETGILFTTEDDYVPATITYGGKSLRAKIRLKGDLQDHWIDDKKWSFLVELKDNSTLFGMRQFALQHPRTRNYLEHWYLLKFLSYDDLLSLRLDCVEVLINGDSLGTYYLLEQFDKQLVENNGLREGPLLKFDDWAFLYPQLYHQNSSLWDDEDKYGASALKPYSLSKLITDENQFNQFIKAKTLLESFREGKLATHDVFDVQKLARRAAIDELFRSPVPNFIHTDNIRFYYNPVTSLIEPIWFESGITPLKKIGLIGSSRAIGASGEDMSFDWTNSIFRDEVFFKEYVQALEEISKPEVLDSFFSGVEPEADEMLRMLHRSYPAYSFDKKGILYENQEFIRGALNPLRAVLAYLKETNPQDGLVTVQVGNFHSLPIEIVSLVHQGREYEPTTRILLQPKFHSKPMAFEEATFSVAGAPASWNSPEAGEMQVRYRILGASTFGNTTLFPWPYSVEAILADDLTRKSPNAGQFEFLSVNETTSTISIMPGNWILRESVVIPAGYTVLCTGGTALDLRDGATILSYSAFQCAGEEGNPVSIVSQDASGGGLVVLNVPETSYFYYVVFENLSAPRQLGWGLTGAITFYESPVEFRHCLFRNSQAEDGLNAIRTDVTMEGCLFEGSLSDCFDWDFVKGTVKDTSFIGCGNDGLDISGSVADVANIITKVGDKGISIGENSKATLKGITVEGGLIGIASKDLSEVTAEDVRISGSQYGIAAYQKKPEFGPGILSARNVMMEDVQQELIVEIGSSVSIDGTVTEGWDTGVDARLYPEG